MVEPDHPDLSLRQQCDLLGLSRATLYYEAVPETAANLRLMRLIDRQYTACPFYGSRRITAWLVKQGEVVNRKRVQRLLRLMGLEAIYPKPRLSANPHKVFPYLLRNVAIERVDQVWSADIACRCRVGSCTWRRSSPIAAMWWRGGELDLDGSFCQEMPAPALEASETEPFNTDQGVQFTAAAWTERLQRAGVSVSMDGRRTLSGQRVRGATVAFGQVRGCVSRRYEQVPDWSVGKGVLPVLQHGAIYQSLAYETPEAVYQREATEGMVFSPRPPSALVKGGRNSA